MKALYLEPDEEITSVVDRLKEVDDEEVVIVVPKRAGILQSIVNLKLLRYQAEQMKKRISLVTTDKTGRNLASAVGLTVHQKMPEKAGKQAKAESAVKEPVEEIPIKYRRQPPKEPASDDQAIGFKKGAEPKIATKSIADAPPEELDEIEPEPEASAEETKIPVKVEKDAPKSKRRKRRLPKVTIPKVTVPNFRKAKATKPKTATGPKAKRLSWKIAAAIGLVLLLGAGTAAAVVLPKATVTVTPKTTPVNASVPMTFSTRAPSVNVEAGIVPAKTIEVTKEGTRQVTASGRSEGGEKASGEITVVSELPRNQSLVARTRFQAPDGRIFRSQSAVVVPARQRATVRVVADDGGQAGNLAAGTRLTIPGLQSTSTVYGLVENPLTGGTDSATTNISEQDVEKAKAELSAQIAREGEAEAKSKLAVGYTLNPKIAAVTVLASSTDPQVGAAATTFTVTGRVRVTYFTYQEKDYEQVYDPKLAAQIPAGTELTDQTEETFEVTQSSRDQLSGNMKVETSAATSISKDQVKEEIKGKSPEEAEQALAADGQASNVEIKLFPFWVMSIPGNADKIIVEFRPSQGLLPVPTNTPTATPAAAGTQPQI